MLGHFTTPGYEHLMFDVTIEEKDAERRFSWRWHPHTPDAGVDYAAEPLRRMRTEDAEELLRSMPGIGPKIARCVLLYSLGRDVFPVDSNCHRILRRLGFLPQHIDVKGSHDFLQRLVSQDIRRSLHVNFVHHGRSTCTIGVPHCDACTLLDLCPTGHRLRSRQPDAPL